MSFIPGYGKLDHDESDNFGVDWVIHYQFGTIDDAIEEFRSLIRDLDEAGLRTQVRHGPGVASLLVFIRLPRDLLGNMMYKSKIKDWLFGIIHKLPTGGVESVVETANPAEELRSVYHTVTWQKDLGGAGITPNFGKWKNVVSSFPLHNQLSNGELLRGWSKTTSLTVDDLDVIRDLFGEKVAFYFAFIHCYSLFLIFPAVCGIICWFYFGPYSITFALANCLWSVVFVEFWKLRETDLSLRWGVKGVRSLKVNRVQYVWDKEVKDPITGQVRQVFSARKQLLRQLLLIPFTTVAALALGSLIVVTFAMEVFISEVYNGPFKGYLEFLPTVLFSLSIPTITSFLTTVATRLTDYENYRTGDEYELAHTQKTFVMNFITSFLPTVLTAFVYVPFGDKIVPYLDVFRVTALKSSVKSQSDFHIDSNRLQQEVIYLSVTAQVLNFGEEIVLPYVKHYLWRLWREYRMRREQAGRTRSHSKVTNMLILDPPEELEFLRRVRNEAEADRYSVQDDILEMCVQFGYLALFGVAWPLVPLGFLLNNWLELRGDFFKLSLECKRPPPARSDTIGPCLQGLEFLAWLGTLSSAAIVHIYRGRLEEVSLSYLLLTVFIAEQAYLAVRVAVRGALQKLGSDTVRREEARQYAVRKSYLDAHMGSTSWDSNLSEKPKPSVRFSDCVDVYPSAGQATVTTPTTEPTARSAEDDEPSVGIRRRTSERGTHFWSLQKTSAETIDAGIKLIRVMGSAKPKGVKDETSEKSKAKAKAVKQG